MKIKCSVLVIIIVILFIFSGCSNNEKVELESLVEELKINNDIKMKEIENLEIEKNTLEEDNRKFMVEIEELTNKVTQLETKLNVQQVLKEDQAVYDRWFSIDDVVLADFTRYLKNRQNLRVYPYEDAASIGTIGADQPVRILAIGMNDIREKWALIEALNFGKYGYVKIDALEVRKFTPYISNTNESIGGIRLGDHITKTFSKFGHEYTIYKNERGLAYGFDGAYLNLDKIGMTINEIAVDKRGYETVEGFQVGDNAKEVIEHYKILYEMNENESLFSEYPETIFDLGEGYIIRFDIDTEEITSESIITRIKLRNIYFGEY
jgi:hypothetical protein